MNLFKNRGITIIETLIVIAIIGIISSIVFVNLSDFRNEQSLKNTTIDVVSLLNKARQKTLSSVNSTNYSVHFEMGSATLFTGATYNSLDPTNEVIYFNSSVNIPVQGGLNIGGGNDVTFERLTGDTIGGTIIIRLVSDETQQKTITINKTGVISSN
jgi:prepilin-type N-terminal cleavage/methylation domain-containing protein